MVLLHLGRWIRGHHPSTSMDMWPIRAGAMASEFDSTFRPVRGLLSRRRRTRDAAMTRSDLRRRWRRRVAGLDLCLRMRRRYDLIYANSVPAILIACRAAEVARVATPIVAHVHEMQAFISGITKDLAKDAARVSRFIAASEVVKRELVQVWGIAESRVRVVPECAVVAAASSPRVSRASQDPLRVGAVGLAHWRKGPELFIQTARLMRIRYPEVPVHFTWVGGVDPHYRTVIGTDTLRGNLKDTVQFVGEQERVDEWLRNLDVLLLPSREDPFPLACIEAGMAGVPTICFEGASGTAEVLTEGGGVVVPYLDTMAMADALARYWHEPDRLARDGAKAREVFDQFTPDRICPRLWEVIEGV